MVEPELKELLMKSLSRLLDKVRRGKVKITQVEEQYLGVFSVGGVPKRRFEKVSYKLKLPEKKSVSIFAHAVNPNTYDNDDLRIFKRRPQIQPTVFHYELQFMTGKIQIDSACITPGDCELYKIASDLFEACNEESQREAEAWHEKQKEISRKLEIAQRKKVEKFLKSL